MAKHTELVSLNKSKSCLRKCISYKNIFFSFLLLVCIPFLLESQLGESQAFTEDRTKLAAALDAAEAKNAQHAQSADDFAAREAEFKRLAAQTTEQLDRIINDVTRVLSKGTIAG